MNETTSICRHCTRIIRRVEFMDGSARWVHADGTPEGYDYCRTGTTAGPPNDTPGMGEQVKGTLNTLLDSLTKGLRDAETELDRKLSEPVSGAPPCADHVERQHRDMKPPWCNRCGWTRGRDAIPAAKHGPSDNDRIEKSAAERQGDVP